MDPLETLQAECDHLRNEVEQHRLRELAELREQLAQARADVLHFRQEAERNAALGRQIHTEAQAEIARLRTRIQSLEAIPNARESRSNAR